MIKPTGNSPEPVPSAQPASATAPRHVHELVLVVDAKLDSVRATMVTRDDFHQLDSKVKVMESILVTKDEFRSLTTGWTTWHQGRVPFTGHQGRVPSVED